MQMQNFQLEIFKYKIRSSVFFFVLNFLWVLIDFFCYKELIN